MILRKPIIRILLMTMVVAACSPSVKGPELAEGPTFINTPSKTLSAIDSLMWHRPDSALLVLMTYEGDTGAFNSHYTQLLASELLYKNDYAQTNRTELLEAVAYFDSLLVLADTRGASRKNAQNMTIAFLDARAHYINGAGYYEQDSLVPACAEYLKTLEVMEEHFEGKDLVGHQARFMAYTYNRLGDMFSEQFMMEPAITCYENALVFCRIEPTSPQGISNILSRLGLQYDKLGNKEKMREYYGKALEEMPSSDNLCYRDLVAIKALSDYQLGSGIEQPLQALKGILEKSADESERLTRFITIGDIYFEEGLYDSARHYLEPVFENKEDIVSQIQAAEYLHFIYDSLQDKEKSDKYMRFLAEHKKSESQNKALVSQLNDFFQNYLSWKLERKTTQEKRDAVLRTIKILVPIAIVIASIIVIILRKRNKKKLAEQDAEAQMKLEISERQHRLELKKQQTEAKQELETESKRHAEAMEAAHQAHRMQQAALSGRLKRSNEELRDISNQLEQMLAKNVSSEAALSNDYKAFVNTPVCLYIVGLVHKQQFKSKMDYLIYKDDALNKEQLLALRNAAEQHLALFVSHLRNQFPGLTDNDMDYCYLILLGLNEADISALLQKAYTTVCDRSRKINRIIGATGSLYHTLHHMLS